MFGTAPSVDLSIEIKNHGNTPARVTNVLVNAWVSPVDTPLPADIVYRPMDGPATTGAFLVGDDSFLFTGSIRISEVDFECLRERRYQLHVVGYLDYIDQFGERHRGGYARLYDADRDNNNLIYVNAREYNCDHVRPPGEGDDWDVNS